MSALARVPFRHGDAEFAMLMHLSGYGLETLDLERAFDGLIAWPAGEGFTELNATERRMLLIGVCERLMEAGDKRRIPPQTYDTIVDFVDARVIPQYSYAAWTVLGHGVFFYRLDVERAGA